MSADAGETVLVRPRTVRWVSWVCAVVVVGFFAVVAALLPRSATGVYFRFADQVALVVLGVLIGAGILLMTRPRVRADVDGIEVRNVLSTRYLTWDLVREVSFPDGASFARLELPGDEYIAVLAIQAVDKEHAATALERIRALHAAAHARADDRVQPRDP